MGKYLILTIVALGSSQSGSAYTLRWSCNYDTAALFNGQTEKVIVESVSSQNCALQAADALKGAGCLLDLSSLMTETKIDFSSNVSGSIESVNCLNHSAEAVRSVAGSNSTLTLQDTCPNGSSLKELAMNDRNKPSFATFGKKFICIE